MKKRRVTVTLDADVIDGIVESLANSGKESLSNWVNEAVRPRCENDLRMAYLADAVKAYEAEHGEITAEEMARQEQQDRDSAAASRAAMRGRRTG